MGFIGFSAIIYYCRHLECSVASSGKGIFAASFLWGISASFVLAKVIRDNDEDREAGLRDTFFPTKEKE